LIKSNNNEKILLSLLRDERFKILHQLVHLGGCVSDMALMKYGVPQGSILGPLFFTVFINDLPLHVSSSEIDLYADNTTITSSANCGSLGRTAGIS